MRALPYALVLLLFAQTIAADAPRGSLFASDPSVGGLTASALFVGRAQNGLFAPRATLEPTSATPVITQRSPSDLHVIYDIIQEAESRREGYDAVQYGARIKPAKRPTQMTLTEVFDWIDATPGQPHAIGRYQFIPKTLRRVVQKAGISHSKRFGPAVQDELANVLLAEAGLHAFRDGTLGRTAFMNNLAKIWAGLPNSAGKSHYEGYAGNKAAITWARFDAVMAQITPTRG